MPFLRAALLRKNLQPEREPVKVLPTPVVDEQIEPEEEFTPTQIEDLHRLIDARTEEAERALQGDSEPEEVIFVVPEFVPEPEIVTLDAESVQEILESENEPAELESDIEPEISQQDSEQEVAEDDIIPESEIEQEESESHQEAAVETEIITPESETTTQEDDSANTDFDENSILDEPSQNDTPQPEPEIITPEPEPEQEESSEPSQEDSQPEPKSQKDYSGSQLNYDFTSGERYVDKVSTKTEFDKMLDELANISKELLSWQAEKFARDYTGKFNEGETSQADARKYEAFLGGYITNAAMLLYDKGYRDAAIKQLEQAISILQARKKLEDETSAIKSRVEEQNDSVDLSDILGLFGDG